MAASIQISSDTASLDELVTLSSTQAVLFFKHSSSCPISHFAERELLSWLGEAPEDLKIVKVVVQHARPLSNLIAERLGVRHESPQAILIRDGDVSWHASHGRINRDALRKAVEAVMEEEVRA